ncbi:hypothetical protein MUK42_36561 [Musa troglodytarum]|uniref:Uncharacterized protein n=1 Tax=Musa troglodytarum TaxID=320322 RepID=A0A9E7JYI4_9LILI|nr:hypothetical protein MUK42_36561 [Musa troglodytarum]
MDPWPGRPGASALFGSSQPTLVPLGVFRPFLVTPPLPSSKSHR